MKQLLFLLFLPCLALAQYPGNANQKITLGEQTTADGLVWRGVAADTTLTVKSDTAAYFVLDTVNLNLYTYKASASGRKWRQLGADTAAIAYVNTYGTQTVNGAKTFTSELTATRFNPTANTATGTGMYLPATNSLGFSTAGTQRIHINSAGKVGIGTQMTTANNDGIFNVAGDMTFENNFFCLRANGSIDDYAQFKLRESGVSGNYSTGETGQVEFVTYSANNSIGALVIGNFHPRPVIFGTSNLERVRVKGDGEMNIGYGATDNGAYPLQVNGQIFATNATIATSDEKFKENITSLNKGLEIVNKLKPVTFNFISDTKNNFSEYEEVGFIAQDVDRALSTETFAKSIVKAADDSEPTSTMGLATLNLIPILVKAIQEQNALIKALEQRIINLENK